MEKSRSKPVRVQDLGPLAAGEEGTTSELCKLSAQVLQSSKEVVHNHVRRINPTAVAVAAEEADNPVATGVDSNVTLLRWDDKGRAERTVNGQEMVRLCVSKVANVMRDGIFL